MSLLQKLSRAVASAAQWPGDPKKVKRAGDAFFAALAGGASVSETQRVNLAAAKRGEARRQAYIAARSRR